jgi:uncharacterized membrane protein
MTISVQGRIPAPPDQVWAVLSDVRGWPDWLPTVDAVEPAAPDEPDGVGASYTVRQPRLPRARWTITDWRPDEGFTWQSRNPGVTATGTHELRRDAEGGTEVELALDWQGPLAWLVRAAYGRLSRRYVETEAASLAARCQGPGAEG